ncbi:hypothetical protein NDU88_007111 [Pleurodeles waltl]|uniref:Uncharacterized protein n=1 Tax=Pleurodeles waltl TaxID=8319 RepID=A0AAV7N1D1_PLEWA|nr:hypothetical protein NDU88_007111 [Pleurodeles waltl]
MSHSCRLPATLRRSAVLTGPQGGDGPQLPRLPPIAAPGPRRHPQDCRPPTLPRPGPASFFFSPPRGEGVRWRTSGPFCLAVVPAASRGCHPHSGLHLSRSSPPSRRVTAELGTGTGRFLYSPASLCCTTGRRSPHPRPTPGLSRPVSTVLPFCPMVPPQRPGRLPARSRPSPTQLVSVSAPGAVPHASGLSW